MGQLASRSWNWLLMARKARSAQYPQAGEHPPCRSELATRAAAAQRELRAGATLAQACCKSTRLSGHFTPRSAPCTSAVPQPAATKRSSMGLYSQTQVKAAGGQRSQDRACRHPQCSGSACRACLVFRNTSHSHA